MVALLRRIVQMIFNLFNKGDIKPVRKASGSNIFIDDSANLPLVSMRAYGNSTQDGTPTPDNPIDIVSTGDKGYFDGELLHGTYSSSNGAYSANNTSAVCSKNTMPCKEGDEIIVTYPSNLSDSEKLSQIQICYYKNGVFIGFDFATNISISERNRFIALEQATEFNITLIAYGTMSPATVKHIGVIINGKYALIVKENNKNLLESSNTSYDSYGVVVTPNTDEGTYTIEGTTTQALSVNLGTATLKAGEYILSGFITDRMNVGYLYFYLNGSPIISSYKETTFIITEETTINVVCTLTTSTTYSDVIAPMICRAEVTDNTYEPCKENVTYIPLDEPLRGIGEVKDEIVKQNGVWGVLRKFASVVLNGSETWTYASSSISDVRRKQCSSLSNVKYVDGNSIANILCSHYISGTEGDGYRGTKQCISTLNGYSNRVVIYDATYNGSEDLEDYKAWLAENPITVQYELATKIFTPFADQTPFNNMATYNPVTIISSDAEMDIEYVDMTYDQMVNMLLNKINNVKRFEYVVSEEITLDANSSHCITFDDTFNIGIDNVLSINCCYGNTNQVSGEIKEYSNGAIMYAPFVDNGTIGVFVRNTSSASCKIVSGCKFVVTIEVKK